jgi:DNA-binding NarL/FixJ family response regulator
MTHVTRHKQQDPIKVLIIGDDAILRDTRISALKAQAEIIVVGETVVGPEAIAITQELTPNVVVMDMPASEVEGVEALRTMVSHCPKVQVLAIAPDNSEGYFSNTVSAGAAGYLVNDFKASELVSAVRALSAGDVFLSSPMTKRLLEDFQQQVVREENKDGLAGLTPRETEILRLLAEGRTNQAVADLLTLSTNTVRTHRYHMMAKLGLRNYGELTKYALYRGLITSNQ